MTDLRKAAEMALEVLCKVTYTSDSPMKPLIEKVTDDLSEALAQPEQEPVREHNKIDLRCECCGYMTYHREHLGCIRAAAPPSKPDVNQELVEALNKILWTRPPNKNPSRYAHTVEETAFRALAKHDKLKEQA